MLKLQKFTTKPLQHLLQQTKVKFDYCQVQRQQQLWGYVAIAFNKVDADRLKLVGPNRLCAEWMLKNGGAVRLVEMPGKLLRDYNSLPPENAKFHIKVIDATGASVMKIGLEHFRGCQKIDSVIFDECAHLEEDGLDGLVHVQQTLEHLQVSSCNNINDSGLKIIGELKNLKQLKIFNMDFVKNLDGVVKELQQKLPNCKIETKK